MTKYRIRLPGGRVIGPFTKLQLFELKAKGHIKGNEEGQVFPTGSWGPLSDLDIYNELIDENRTLVQSLQEDKTFAINLDELRSKRAQKEIEELVVEKHEPMESLTETVKMPSAILPSAPRQPEEEPLLVLDEDVPEGFEDKTLINPVAQQEIERMRKEMELERKRHEAEDVEQQKQYAIEKAFDDEEARKISEDKAAPDALTQVISLDNLQEEIMGIAHEEEKHIEKQRKAYEKKKLAEESADESTNAADEAADEAAKKKKKRLVIMLLAAVLIYAVFFPDDDSKKIPVFQNLPPQIIFPIPFDKADKKASELEFEKGIERLLGGTYPEIVNAGVHFKAAYENDISNTKALHFLVRTYAQELPNSKSLLDDAHTVFNIVQSKRAYLIQDPNGVMGLNLFYTAIGKHDAAVDVINRYLKLNPEIRTQELFGVYLESLMKVGQVELAASVYQGLVKAPEKNQYALEALIDFSYLNQEMDKSMEYVNEGIKKYPQLVRFYLIKADLLLKNKNVKEIPALLEEASKRNLEYNDLYRAKYLEVSGLYDALNGKVDQATKSLKKSLELHDSNELRMKLADLSANTAAEEANRLILESQAAKLVFEAKNFYDKKSYTLALSSAAKASETLPGHIPSELFLAKVQLKLGLAKEGLKTLEDLAAKYPDNKDVNLALIESYIQTYKFKDAQTRIAVISATDIRNTWEYASVSARLFIKMGDPLNSIQWLKTSINLNPLNDQDIFLLAEILLKRFNFDGARNLLNKCMELDPINPDYRIAYAKLIYETEDDQAAIGYLLGILKDFTEDPKVLGEIAIFYFRSGQVKEFQQYKEKLEKLPKKDKSIYEFMIRTALLDESYDEIPGHVTRLIEIEPGDLESMMTAGRVLYENNKKSEAAEWFSRVAEKLPSYPKVQYYIAKIRYDVGRYDEAIKLAEDDIKINGESDLTLVFMGEVYVQKNELVTAENFYKKAQKINAKSYEALIGLADISVLRNNYELALDLYKRAAKERNEEPSIHRKLGDVYRLLGQGTLAIESYKLYLEMDPEAQDKKKVEDYIQLMQ